MTYSTSRPAVLLALCVLFTSSLLNRVIVPLGPLNLRLEHFVAPAIFGCFVLYRIRSYRYPLVWHSSSWLVLAWVGVNLLSSLLFAPDLLDSLKHVVRFALLASIFFTLAQLPPFKPQRWVDMVVLWLGLSLLAMLYGIVGWLVVRATGRPIWGIYWPENFPYLSVEGTFLERNLYGILSGTTFVTLLTIYLRQRALRSPAMLSGRHLLLGMVVSGTALVISLTRSAWVSVALVVPLSIVSVERSRLDRLKQLMLLLLTALPVTIALFLVLPRLHPDADLVVRLQSFGRLATDPNWQVRLTDARAAFRDWLARPLLGNGTGSFAQLHGLRAGTTAWISNLLLHTLVDTGVVGLVIQVALFTLIFRDAWRFGQRCRAPQLQIGLPALAAGLLTMVIAYQATDGTWLALCWIHLGLMANGISVAREAGLAAAAGPMVNDFDNASGGPAGAGE